MLSYFFFLFYEVPGEESNVYYKSNSTKQTSGKKRRFLVEKAPSVCRGKGFYVCRLVSKKVLIPH